MILNEMKLFFGVNLADLSSDIHLTEYHIHLTDLLFHLSKDRRAIERAADHVVPVSALFPQYFLISVVHKFLIGFSLRNK